MSDTSWVDGSRTDRPTEDQSETGYDKSEAQYKDQNVKVEHIGLNKNEVQHDPGGNRVEYEDEVSSIKKTKKKKKHHDKSRKKEGEDRGRTRKEDKEGARQEREEEGKEKEDRKWQRRCLSICLCVVAVVSCVSRCAFFIIPIIIECARRK